MYSIDCIADDKKRNNIHHYIDNIFGTKIGGAPAILQSKLTFLNRYCIGLTTSVLHIIQQTW